ncbi:hypothetical protein CRM22_005231 [Opisthorchis felineus]|uniref:Ig-like domain-containing protein n=1 Tax=Opisthorchis felineus TaxID=147828 RepID=A0A4V3SF06_OPIFE|nr:hypothetical protein CRM22_005231 [Opisthorchis felineus]
MLYLLLFAPFILPHIARANIEVVQWVNETENFSVCCTLEPKGDQAVILKLNNKRLQAIAESESGYERFAAYEEHFFKDYPQWAVDPLSKPGSQMCVHKIRDTPMELNANVTVACEKMARMGLGSVIERELIRVKVYRRVAIVNVPDTCRVKENEAAILTCNATGYPDLHLSWKSKDNGELLKENRYDKPNGLLELVLNNVTSNQHDTSYVCEARTSYPADTPPVTAETKLEVYLPPTIKLDSYTIHTELGAQESFQIYVTGFPVPSLECDSLEVEGPRKIWDEPRGGTHAFLVTVDGVTQQHLTTFICEASNEAGSEIKEITFTVAPAKPVILSPNWTSHADYYLVHWRTHSRVPLENVTLEVEEYNSNSTAGPVTQSNRKLFYSLDPNTMDKNEVSLLAPGDNKQQVEILSTGPWEQLVWHHLSNLSANTDHILSVTVCNKYDCASSVIDSVTDNPSMFTFRTAEYNGSNKIKPGLLALPPMEVAKLQEEKFEMAVTQMGGRMARCRAESYMVHAFLAWTLCANL